MEKQFTVQDLERAGERGMVAGQIAITEDIIKQIRRDATAEFDAGHDEAAKALREEANSLTSLIGILNNKLNRLKSKVRAQQIADTVIDANLELSELT